MCVEIHGGRIEKCSNRIAEDVLSEPVNCNVTPTEDDLFFLKVGGINWVEDVDAGD